MGKSDDFSRLSIDSDIKPWKGMKKRELWDLCLEQMARNAKATAQIEKMATAITNCLTQLSTIDEAENPIADILREEWKKARNAERVAVAGVFSDKVGCVNVPKQ
jgi:hypothetical protein